MKDTEKYIYFTEVPSDSAGIVGRVSSGQAPHIDASEFWRGRIAFCVGANMQVEIGTTLI